MGRIHVENTDFTGGNTQVYVPVNRQKYHCPRHRKILDGYGKFNNYAVIGSSRDTNNSGRSDGCHHVMTSEASILVSRLSHNNNNTTVLSTPFVPYLSESHGQLLKQINRLQQVRIRILCAPNDQNQSFLLGNPCIYNLKAISVLGKDTT